MISAIPHILVVDDEPAIRELLSEILTDTGYRVSCAEDGRQALDCTVLEVPDLIMSDIQMPRMHGLALVERVRADGHMMPIILISSWTPPPGLPGVRFIRKPFDVDQIIAAVALDLMSAGSGARAAHQPRRELMLAGERARSVTVSLFA